MKVTALGLPLLLAFASAACTGALQSEDDSDPAIKARIAAALEGRKDIDIRHLSLEVYNRLVTISGIVSSSGQIDTINRLIKRTPGVDEVMDNVVVQE